jgi:hypothetical protein
MVNSLVIIGLYFSRFLMSFCVSGVDKQPVIQLGLRVLKIVGIQGQSSRNQTLDTFVKNCP